MLIVKPCKQAEIDFYQTTANHPKFQYYIPIFLGTLELNQAAAQPKTGHPYSHSRGTSQNLVPPSSGGHVTGPVEAWTPSGGGAIAAKDGIVLENVAYGFDRPNILDVKLGRRLWGDDAPPAKRQKLDKAAAETTSGPLGFRIAGMRTWMGENAGLEFESTNGYKKCDKLYGRSFHVDTVSQGFEEYFLVDQAGVTRHLASKVIRRFVEDLRGLQNVLQSEESRMYSASLLFVYEGNGERLQGDIEAAEPFETTIPSNEGSSRPEEEDKEAFHESDGVGTFDEMFAREPNNLGSDSTRFTIVKANINNPPGIEAAYESSSESEATEYKVHALKLIDFAHANWTPGHGPDENLLFGIRNVIKILEKLIS